MKKLGFTLAEVLITLGIIGVVAAMTMPTLIQNYQKKVTVNKLKKIYAELAQVVKLAEAEYGATDTWDYKSQPGTSDVEKIQYLLNNYIIKHLKTVKICTPENSAECNMHFTDLGRDFQSTLAETDSTMYIISASGYALMFRPGGIEENSEYIQHIQIVADINGPNQGKNKYGKDVFQMTINFDGKKGLHMAGAGLTREALTTPDNRVACNINQIGSYCGALIQLDGWEISKDYPW